MKRPSLNHCYRLVWSDAQTAWMPVPESARARGKNHRLLLAAALLAPAIGLAAPAGGVVTSGTATISQTGSVTNINQSTQKSTINWQGFSVGAGETVNFNQPDTSAMTLNRVIGNERSVIDGALNANGRVFLINSNGVLFGKGSNVSVGGLVASARNIDDADFNAGNYVFKGDRNGSVINQGTLAAGNGGYIALLGNNVSNQGVISATKGTVALSAGNKITLNFNGDSLVGVTLNEGTLDAMVENKQAIYADGGTVLLTAKAADELLSAQVNNSGIVRARTIDDLKGSITLDAQGGTTHVDGTLDAGAPVSGDGGSIDTSGESVKVADTASVTTQAANGRRGTWLIDPTDFTVAASGGDITGATLSSLLRSGNVTIASSAGSKGTSGDVDVDDTVAWNSPSTLTLTAAHDININGIVTAEYSAYSSASPTITAGLTLDAGHDININNAVNLTNAALAMNYGDGYNILTKASYSGTTLGANGTPVARTDTSGGVYGSLTFNGGVGSGDSLSINGNAYTLIYSMSQLAALDNTDPVTGNGNFDPVIGNFAIAQDLQAGGVTYLIPPIYFFSGTLAGLGHKISHFTMDSPPYNAGLIGDGVTYGPVVIRDLGMESVDFTNVANNGPMGALLGQGQGTLRNDYSTGSISAQGGNLGGLVGTFDGTIDSSYSSVDITSTGWGVGGVGGLAGAVVSTVSNSDATGNITTTFTHSGNGAYGVGGLAGTVNGTLSNDYATGNIASEYASGTTGANYQIEALGGLVGAYGSGVNDSLTNSYATGSVTGGAYLGGLIGAVSGSLGLDIDNAYATGDVTSLYSASPSFSTAALGGLIGGIGGGGLFGTVSGNVSISKVFATGNVAAQGGGDDVGGLIGQADLGSGTGSLTNAYATGNVSVASVPGLYTSGAGGLIGEVENFAVSNVHADGSVNGYSHVGGLIGTAFQSSITDSYETGAATAVDQTQYGAGGLVGYMSNSTTSNTYYNADVNTQAFFGGWGQAPGHATGLAGSQVPDSQYYANGTIGQVLAARNQAAAEAQAAAAQAQAAADAQAAAAARTAAQAQAEASREKAFEAAAHAVGGNELAQVLNAPPKPVLVADTAVNSPTAMALDQNITFSAPKYSADILGIDVDGQTFQLDDEKKTKR